ncbi:hypothetical protein [Streptomyces sp. SAI-127]|uniref:hypothetical protein n=1 Tax=Streptomyces sp. SAI-127 TaxID=2940543 RepID=UPI002474DD0D|nr:hypothetical protein [Streptomyces sp. SAI-127]MDH6484206.1 hypothetical protein [Streptomyces sp. SAI-127]
MTPFITAKNSVDVASAAGKERPRSRAGSISGALPRRAVRRCWATNTVRTAAPHEAVAQAAGPG